MKAGWKTVKLADVAEMRPPKSEVKHKGLKPTDEVGFLPMEDLTQFQKQAKALKTRPISEVSNSYTYFANGDVLMAKISPCFQNGKMGIATGLPNGVGYGSSEYFVFRPTKELSAEWLFYYLQDPTFRRHATGKFSGTVGQQRLPKELIEDLEIPLPPLAEQKRIVALLDEAFAGIDEAMAKAEATQANAEALLKSYLHATFRTPKPGWHESKLGAVGKVSMCKRILKEQTSPTGDIPFYKIGTFGRQPDAYIPSSIYEDFRGKYPFPNKGDILISAAGTIGRRVRYDGEPAYFQDSNIVWIDNDERLVLNDYLYHVYSACEWNSTSGATISRLYNDDLRNVDILFPPSQSEQKAIAKTMDEVGEEIRKLEVTLQLRLEAHSKLKSSLLTKAFAGELTA